MSNIAAQAASLGMTGSGVNQANMSSIGSGLFGGQSAAQFVANQVAQNNAANAAQSIAQQQLASQGVTPLGGIAGGVANQIQGAGAAEQNALEAGGNPYADSEQNVLTAGMAVGDAPIATAGNFNPQTQFAAARMFGPQKYRRKPLINF
tara:strand:+ start:75 stop:521 length:447 start_codon:yes stop_codon:yes gene_type:complete